jgi:hypothetical protein
MSKSVLSPSGPAPAAAFTAVSAIAAFAVLSAAPAAQAQTFTRKPFLQLGSSKSGAVCWRVNPSSKLEMKYGTDPAALDKAVTQAAASTDGCLEAKDLQPSTKYYYELWNGTAKIAGSADHYFVTHPPKGAPGKYSFWIIGDAGTGSSDQKAVRDAYLKVNGGSHSDGFILLGDNAYEDGTDAELTAKHFNVYPTVMQNTFMWATIGNHENQSNGVGHLAAFTLPTEAQSGGVASKSELYYSFDFGNIHWICLDSEKSGNKVTDPMYKWLEQDLQAAKQDWLIAFWHTSPYSWGSHDSDEEGVEMRERFVALLEKYGVDMVFTGHSHNYERSYLLNGAYGMSSDNKAKAASVILDKKSGGGGEPYKKAASQAANQGAVYTVAGSSGDVGDVKGLHPVMFVQHAVLGSVILDIDGGTASARFIDNKGAVRDSWQLSQPATTPTGKRPAPRAAGARFSPKGRHLAFSGNSDAVFHLYGTDGKVLYKEVPPAHLALGADRFPAGEYYYRYGMEVGSLTLP